MTPSTSASPTPSGKATESPASDTEAESRMFEALKITPPSTLRIVPLGDFHIFFRLNSFTRASSGVMVAHFTPTPYFLMASAASTVTWSFVASRFSTLRS